MRRAGAVRGRSRRVLMDRATLADVGTNRANAVLVVCVHLRNGEEIELVPEDLEKARVGVGSIAGAVRGRGLVRPMALFRRAGPVSVFGPRRGALRLGAGLPAADGGGRRGVPDRTGR